MTVTGGPPGASSVRNCTDKPATGCSVSSVGATGELLQRFKFQTFIILHHPACLHYRDGAHCDKCKADHYLADGSDTSSPGVQACAPCECHPEGSEAGQCEAGSGQCPCRPGLTGLRCDACTEKRGSFPLCRPCACLQAGSEGGAGACVQQSGSCQCKLFVTGDNCDQCAQGYFEVSRSTLKPSY